MSFSTGFTFFTFYTIFTFFTSYSNLFFRSFSWSRQNFTLHFSIRPIEFPYLTIFFENRRVNVNLTFHFFHEPFFCDHEWDSQKNKIFVHLHKQSVISKKASALFPHPCPARKWCCQFLSSELCSQSFVESAGAIWRDIFGAALTLTARLMQHHRHTKKRKPNPDLITAGARKSGRRKRNEILKKGENWISKYNKKKIWKTIFSLFLQGFWILF